jgi:hypothetical protein
MLRPFSMLKCVALRIGTIPVPTDLKPEDVHSVFLGFVGVRPQICTVPTQKTVILTSWYLFKRSVVWDVTPYCPLKISGHFAETRLLMQGRKISEAKNQREAGNEQADSCWYIQSLKMDAEFSSETSDDFHQGTQYYVP